MRLSYPVSLLAVGGCWATVVVAPGSCGEAAAAAVAVASQLEQLLLSLQRVEHLKAKLNDSKLQRNMKIISILSSPFCTYMYCRGIFGLLSVSMTPSRRCYHMSGNLDSFLCLWQRQICLRFRWYRRAESIEWFIEDQDFSLSDDLTPPPPPPPLPSASCHSYSVFLCQPPVEITDGRGGRGWGRAKSIFIRQLESLVFCSYSLLFAGEKTNSRRKCLSVKTCIFYCQVASIS